MIKMEESKRVVNLPKFSKNMKLPDSRIFRTGVTGFPVLVFFLLILMPGCGPSWETMKKNYEQIGDANLNPEVLTLGSLNRILLIEGKKTENPETNTGVYEWYYGAVRAKFITEYNSSPDAYKLIELEIHSRGQSPFPGSIFEVHLTDPPDKIPEILSRNKCWKIEPSDNRGTAACHDDWKVSWDSDEGKITSFRVYKSGYIRTKTKR